MWENTTPSTELPRDFCARIGPLQLDVVLVDLYSELKMGSINVIHCYLTIALSETDYVI